MADIGDVVGHDQVVLRIDGGLHMIEDAGPGHEPFAGSQVHAWPNDASDQRQAEGSKVDGMAAQSAFPALSSAKTLRLSRGSWVNCPSNVDSTAEPDSATARSEAMNEI